MNKQKCFAILLYCLGSMLVITPCVSATINVPVDESTIQAAIDAAADGDVILVAPGTYQERIDFQGKTISLISQQGATSTIIDGQSLGTVITMESGEGADSVIEGFTITGGNASFGAGIYLLATAPTIRHNIFLNNDQTAGGFGAAIGGFSGSPIIEFNEFIGNTCDSQFTSGVLSFVNGSSPLIHDNLIHDNDCRAINMVLPVGPAPIVFNNTIVRNRVGVHIGNQVSSLSQVYRNNLIALNNIGLEVASEFIPFDAIWLNNNVFGNNIDFSGTQDLTGSNGNLKEDPLFQDALKGNYRLRLGSPLIDVGSEIGLNLPPEDFDGNPRIQDGNNDGVPVVDIGAFETAVFIPTIPVSVPVNSKLGLILLILSILFIVSLFRTNINY